MVVVPNSRITPPPGAGRAADLHLLPPKAPPIVGQKRGIMRVWEFFTDLGRRVCGCRGAAVKPKKGGLQFD